MTHHVRRHQLGVEPGNLDGGSEGPIHARSVADAAVPVRRREDPSGEAVYETTARLFQPTLDIARQAAVITALPFLGEDGGQLGGDRLLALPRLRIRDKKPELVDIELVESCGENLAVSHCRVEPEGDE